SSRLLSPFPRPGRPHSRRCRTLAGFGAIGLSVRLRWSGSPEDRHEVERRIHRLPGRFAGQCLEHRLGADWLLPLGRRYADIAAIRAKLASLDVVLEDDRQQLIDEPSLEPG